MEAITGNVGAIGLGSPITPVLRNWTFRSVDHSSPGSKVLTLLSETFAPWMFYTLEHSFSGTFAPGNFCCLELCSRE